MARLYLLPNWFLSYSIALELIFAIITFLVALYALKIYKVSCQRETKFFSIGFFLISLSYILWFMLNITALAKLSDSTKFLEIGEAITLSNIGTYLHIFLFLIGLIVLVYTTIKTEKTNILTLLILIIISSMFLAIRKSLFFYFYAFIFTLYLSHHYLLSYLNKRKLNLALMFLAFLLLAVSTLDFIFVARNYNHYVIGHILIFISYLLILFNLISVFKNGKKKKQA